MPTDYAGFDGFLGTRASLVLDLLFMAMFAVVLVLAISVYQVKYRQRYRLHKNMQIGLAIVLLAALVVFELDIQLHGWEDRAAGEIGGRVSSLVRWSLYVHLCFAVTTVVLWPVVIVRAVRNFPRPLVPNAHSKWHIVWARVAAVDMVLTSITGCVFYWLAFVR